MSTLVYNHGSAQVNVPAGQSIAVFTRNKASVLQSGNYPNQPATMSKIGTVSGGTVIFGPFLAATQLQVDGGAGDTLYSVGTDPVIQENLGYHQQQPPFALNASGALTPGAINKGLVTSANTGAVAASLPTGAAMDAGSSWNLNDSLDWYVINTGTAAFTVSAAAGHTLIGSAVVAAGASAQFATVKTATGTFVTYRLS